MKLFHVQWHDLQGHVVYILSFSPHHDIDDVIVHGTQILPIWWLPGHAIQAPFKESTFTLKYMQIRFVFLHWAYMGI